MPKVAATLASLLLIGSSIGINIARYPNVGRTTAAGGQPAAAVSAVADLPVAQELLPEKAAPVADGPAAGGPLPVPPAAGRDAATARVLPQAAKAENPPSPPPAAPPIEDRLAPSDSPAVKILAVRPMVPVAALVTDGIAPAAPVIDEEVRRLPPVEPGQPSLAALGISSESELPGYSTTATP